MKKCHLNNCPTGGIIATFDGFVVEVDLPPPGLIGTDNMELLGKFLLQCALEKLAGPKPPDHVEEEGRIFVDGETPEYTVCVERVDNGVFSEDVLEFSPADVRAMFVMQEWCDVMKGADPEGSS